MREKILAAIDKMNYEATHEGLSTETDEVMRIFEGTKDYKVLRLHGGVLAALTMGFELGRSVAQAEALEKVVGL